MGWFPGNDGAAKDLADLMTQIIHTEDSAAVGARILKAVERTRPSAATFAKAMLKYRENDLTASASHLAHAHQLMRVPLDILLAKEQSRSQWMVATVSIGIGVLSLIVALGSLYVSVRSIH